MKIDFRSAALADLPAIIDLLANDELGRGRENAGDPVDQRYLQAFEAINRDPNQLLAVCELDGRLAGCLQLSFIPGLSRTGMWRGQIESVRIAPAFRSQGLGRKIFEWAINTCTARNCGLVQLTTDKMRPDALRFYESLGFSASHDGLKLAL